MITICFMEQFPLLQNMDPPLHHWAHFCNKWTTGILQEQGSANQKFRSKVSNGFINCLSHYVYSSIVWSTPNLDIPPPPQKKAKTQSRLWVCVFDILCIFIYFSMWNYNWLSVNFTSLVVILFHSSIIFFPILFMNNIDFPEPNNICKSYIRDFIFQHITNCFHYLSIYQITVKSKLLLQI